MKLAFYESIKHFYVGRLVAIQACPQFSNSRLTHRFCGRNTSVQSTSGVRSGFIHHRNRGAAHVICGCHQQNARKYFAKDVNLVVGVMFIFWQVLVRHTILRCNFKCGAPQDLQVKPERAPPQIFRVKAHLLWNGQFIAPIDLRPTGQARK